MGNNKIIVFANQKGGVGKTTLCIMFAHYLHSLGKNVYVIDADQQLTVFDRRNDELKQKAKDEEPFGVCAVNIKDKDEVIKAVEIAKNFDGIILIDTPGTITEDGLIPIFVNADAIVCPYDYETNTIKSTGVFIQMMNILKGKFDKFHAKSFFVPNRVRKGQGIEDEKKFWSLSDSLFRGFGEVTTIIYDRVDIRRNSTMICKNEQLELVKEAFEYIMDKINKDNK